MGSSSLVENMLEGFLDNSCPVVVLGIVDIVEVGKFLGIVVGKIVEVGSLFVFPGLLVLFEIVDLGWHFVVLGLALWILAFRFVFPVALVVRTVRWRFLFLLGLVSH